MPILLVRQFRLPAGRRMWELPAGRLDPGENPLHAARRELIEETGFRARSWKRLGSFFPSPGYSSEDDHHLAEDLRAGQARPEADESIECRWFTIRVAVSLDYGITVSLQLAEADLRTDLRRLSRIIQREGIRVA